jgi:putative component of toxin-antitoxin plasmid stabilization module
VASIEVDLAKAAADAGLEAADAGKEQDAVSELNIAKGPGGRFFVKRGDVNVSRGCATEEEAEAEKAKIAATAA